MKRHDFFADFYGKFWKGISGSEAFFEMDVFKSNIFLELVDIFFDFFLCSFKSRIYPLNSNNASAFEFEPRTEFSLPFCHGLRVLDMNVFVEKNYLIFFRHKTIL